MLLLIVLIGCETVNHDSTIEISHFEKKTENTNFLISNDSNNISLNQALFFIDSISKNYSLEDRHLMPIENKMTKISLLKLRNNNLDTLRYYLSLILLKRYVFHVNCCFQSYEIRNQPIINKLGLDTLNNPILYEFFRFAANDIYNYPVDSLISKPKEIIKSSIIITYINKNKKLLKNKEILKYYNSLPKSFRR